MSKQTQQQRAERAAAALRERRRKERRRQVISIGGVVLAIVLIIGGGFLVNSLRDTSSDSAAAAPAAGSDLGLTIGKSSAAHKVVVYEDFLCPYCGELEKATHEKLESLVDAGTLQVEYRPFPFLSRLGPYSEDATEAFAVVLEQSGPEVALTFHDMLYADQPKEEGPFPSEDDLAEVMTAAGADAATVTAFKAGDGKRWAGEALDAANDLGINSTPTVILDGKEFTDGRTVDDLAANLLEAVQ